MSRLSDYAKFDHLDDASSSDEEDQDHRSADVNPGDQHHRPLNPTGAGDAAAPASADASSPPSSATPTAMRSQLHPPPQSQQQLPGVVKTQMTKKGSEHGRYVFEHGGRKIYEWEQSLEEVNIYIDAPPGLKSASQIECVISPTHLTLGLKHSDTGRPYIDEDTFSKVRVSDSSWCVTDLDGRGGTVGGGVINIVLAKAFRGETWDSVLLGARRGEGGGDGRHGDDDAIVDPATRQEIQKELMIERFQEENPGFDFRGAEFNGSVPDPRTFMGGVKYS